MKMKSLYFCAVFKGLILAAISTASVAQDLSVIDLVTECDILAAHPNDPERMAEGVADDLIVPRLAIMACEDALTHEEDEPRFAFQLGRALLAVGREEEAVESFRTAAEQGHAAAWAYLGDVYQFGLGAETNGRLAFEAYTNAVEAGFSFAERQIEQLSFDRTMYTMPYISMFFNGDFEALRTASAREGDRAWIRNYIFSFIEGLEVECGSYLKPSNVSKLYAYRYLEGWNQEDDANIAVAIQTSIAESDVVRFVRRHGCSGLIARHIFDSINRFLES
jgi:hypothetical protein